MGQAEVGERQNVIELPVRVEVFAPERRGTTTRETLLYQILAHELGHALGLPHAADPASIMCCAAGGVDLGDPATRAAYVHARRHPDVRSARAQLAEHYARLWRADH
jgi:sugar (pentulose or hexulose) kinase